MDLIRRDNQDQLAPTIAEFTDEYLAPLDLDSEGQYLSSDKSLILSSIDDSYYEYCKVATRGLDEVETLKAIFRDSDFDDEPALSVLTRHIDQFRELEELNLNDYIQNDSLQVPNDTTPEIAVKKSQVFHEYGTKTPSGMISLDDANIPVKRFIFGMSMIYISETYHNPEHGDYRDALIWSQALISGCDILWTEQKWKYEHPIIDQVLNRLEETELEVVIDFNGLKERF